MRREWMTAPGALVVVALVGSTPALAQTTGTAVAGSSATQAQTGDDNERDLQVVVGEPDFTLGVLPTTLRMPKGKLAFRITHRFTYKINGGSVGEFLENGLGFDSSATTGFELRFGLAPGTQLTVHRTGSRNIQFLAQHQVRAQRRGGPVSLDVVAAIEGQNNFRESYSYVIGGIVSHRFGDHGAVYAEPIGVFNATPELPASDQNTMMIGLGARIRLGASRAYLMAEVVPRLRGYDGGSSVMTFGIEKRVGGHLFQLNVSNAFDTTLTSAAHGGPARKHWHLGFNMTRKFF